MFSFNAWHIVILHVTFVLGYFVITLMLLIGDIRTSDLYKQKDEEKKAEEKDGLR